MKILVACEESQAVCKAFRAKGHEAYSCDIIDCSGGHPEWHIQCDALELIDGYTGHGYGPAWFTTNDGKSHDTPVGRSEDCKRTAKTYSGIANAMADQWG